MLRICLLTFLVLAPACVVMEVPAEGPETKTRRYILEPLHNETGITVVPVVRWDRVAIEEDLKTPLRTIEIQVATTDGEIVYSARSTDAEGLLALEALRIFSEPPGAKVDSDPDYAESGRLAGARRYQLSVFAYGDGNSQVHESVTFETIEAPRESGN